MMAPASAGELTLVGVNHHNADLSARERLSITHDEAGVILGDLRERELTREGVVLSTCNRTELYCLSRHPELVLTELVTRGGRHLESLRDLFYLKRGRDTIRHAFAVASGLDSMILGEPEILGQMKKALAAARSGQFAGAALSRLFERSFAVAKEVRTETDIGRESVSAPAICAQLARRIFGDIEECAVLCIGAGTIIETAISHFAGHRPRRLAIANRTLAHARRLAAGNDLEIVPYEEVTDSIGEFDVILSATSSVLPVLGKGAIERALKARRRRPIAAFDLAVPRDIEAEAGSLEDLFLHTIDDIGAIAGANMAKRQQAAAAARDRIEAATEEMLGWFERGSAVDAIKSLRGRVDAIRDDELARALARLRGGEEAEGALAELARRLSNRLAHSPIAALSEQHANRELQDELGGWYERDERKDNA